MSSGVYMSKYFSAKAPICISLLSLSKELRKEISSLNDSAQYLVKNTSSDLNKVLISKLDDLSTKSAEYIAEVETLKVDAKKRFESFYGRKRWIDYLIIANLTLIPLVLTFMVYWTFFKK